jgi:uncharacterized damage-inducible protein DinB
MSLTESMIAELLHEGKTTRRVLERVPDDKLSWKPHDKSMTLGKLALHIARLPFGIANLVSELTVGLPKFPTPQPESRDEIVKALDEALPYAVEKLTAIGDGGMREIWRMVDDSGKAVLELPRVAVVRNLMLNHCYHHRGQLTVYLRILDVALPSVYGPTADERPF